MLLLYTSSWSWESGESLVMTSSGISLSSWSTKNGLPVDRYYPTTSPLTVEVLRPKIGCVLHLLPRFRFTHRIWKSKNPLYLISELCIIHVTQCQMTTFFIAERYYRALGTSVTDEKTNALSKGMELLVVIITSICMFDIY